ncbi:uncharacterized protein LOC131860248 [Cryptomeria japonica]|uniref:uncharacterized protein LOC131860248 n=1 Tax=Cryptomeria japonica TaxID=3369 RepID=UPI0027DA9D8E|nr:uncharacterized protein LOC131860248 [Cryptomeria japonica]
MSRNLVGYELNYTTVEKKCLAVVFATQMLRHYMLAYLVKLIAKIDPLKYRKAIKGQVNANQLVEAPLRDDTPLHIEFPNANVLIVSKKTCELYFDGSCTQHGSGVGILFITPQDNTIPKSYGLSFPYTNNTAKYEALVVGLKMAIEWNIIELHIYGDSQLVINQLNDEYQTKDDKLMPYKKLVDDFKKYFVEITFDQMPRNENKATDAMATIASRLQTQENQECYEFLVEDLFYPAHDPLTHKSSAIYLKLIPYNMAQRIFT